MSDANKRADNDPSMDDILASIRKIISDDEARAQVAANQPGNSQSAPSQATPAEGPVSPGKPAAPARGPRPNANANPVREDVLLLTDLIMPKLDGLTASFHLLEPGGLPVDVIVVTGIKSS
mgnify:CR=1 FL=1